MFHGYISESFKRLFWKLILLVGVLDYKGHTAMAQLRLFDTLEAEGKGASE